jgi:lipopolysaccharide/colanic/teichoic acid biosynthesis glycosyltransferase
VYRSFGKRLLDLAVTVPALLLLSPVMALMALLVRLNLGSPVLFRHQRPGIGGRPFILLRFRTMTDARDTNGELLPDEQRITQFGQMLRHISLDELPELINVGATIFHGTRSSRLTFGTWITVHYGLTSRFSP